MEFGRFKQVPQRTQGTIKLSSTLISESNAQKSVVVPMVGL